MATSNSANDREQATRDVVTPHPSEPAARGPADLAAQFWRLSPRIGKKKAAMAVGHSILVAAWHILTTDTDYDDLGGDWFARKVNDGHRRDMPSATSTTSATESPSNESRDSLGLILLTGSACRPRRREGHTLSGRARRPFRSCASSARHLLRRAAVAKAKK